MRRIIKTEAVNDIRRLRNKYISIRNLPSGRSEIKIDTLIKGLTKLERRIRR